jgi:hypothetical protein
MVKKGFLKKTGCILISASIILAGWTFMCSSTSDAGLNAGVFTFDSETTSVSASQYRNDASIMMIEGEAGITASIASNAFESCTMLSAVTIQGNANVGSRAFLNDSSLTHFEVNGSASIAEYAFQGCTNLGTFSVGTLTSLNKNAFSDCRELSTILIDNPGTFQTYDGALYQDTTLIYVPAGKKSLQIKDGTTAIASGAFSDGNVFDITFEDAKDITSFDLDQGSWPYFEPKLKVSAIGGANTPIQTFFDKKIELKGTSNYEIIYDSGSGGTTPTPTPSEDTYVVTVKEEFYSKDGTTLLNTNTSTKTFTVGTTNTISPEDYTSQGFATTETAKTVSAAATITFVYTATTDNPVIPTPTPTPTPTPPPSTGKVYTVTVVDEFYKSDLSTMTKTITRSTNKYVDGSSYSFSPTSYTGYSNWGGRNESGVVHGNIKVYFFYKPTDGKSTAETTAGTNGGTTNKSGEGITASAVAQQTNKYLITKGGGQVVSQSGGPVTIVCNGELNKLLYILVDGNVLDKANYSVASGSTILTLTKEYIASLKPGDHVVQFQYNDGYAMTGLKITTSKTTTTVSYKVSSDGSISSGHTKDTTPKTADGFDARYLLCMAIFLLGAGAFLMGRNRGFEALLAEQQEDY